MAKAPHGRLSRLFRSADLGWREFRFRELAPLGDGTTGKGGVELLCMLVEGPGGVTSFPTPLTGALSLLGTGMSWGRWESCYALKNLKPAGIWATRLGSTLTNKADQVSVPAFQGICCFCYCFSHMFRIVKSMRVPWTLQPFPLNLNLMRCCNCVLLSAESRFP